MHVALSSNRSIIQVPARIWVDSFQNCMEDVHVLCMHATWPSPHAKDFKKASSRGSLGFVGNDRVSGMKLATSLCQTPA